MSQNMYDAPSFFENYSKLPRSVHGLAGAAEWPRLREMLPEMGGLHVLDLGCGFGWFCRWAVEEGAENVLGVDLSENMLERARAMTDPPAREAIIYQRQDLETFRIPLAERGTFDLVFSSLTLHYVVDLARLLSEVRSAVDAPGYFVFSVEHPIFTAPSRPGMATAADGSRFWPLDGYQSEGERVTDWLVEGVRKQHRTLATYFNLLREAGFEIEAIDEWHPTPEELEAHPEAHQAWSDENIRPMFLLIAAKSRAEAR